MADSNPDSLVSVSNALPTVPQSLSIKSMFLKKWANPGLFFCLFSFFSNTNFTEKTLGVSRIRARIVGAEGKHADQLTTTTAPLVANFIVST